MSIIEALRPYQSEMQSWRQDLHAHPETAFEEIRTSDFIARQLASYGIKVTRGLGITGVVGTLTSGNSAKRIGLRADMDALHIEEENDFAHRSVIPGKMHACGHDGHTSMLLGAAKYLAQSGNFNGSVHFIFQPAEENEGGAAAMIKDGLFRDFPVDSIYGMHNKPGVPVGEFAIRSGAMLASYDIFDIKLLAGGTHAGLPYSGPDTIGATSHLLQGLGTLVRQTLHPADPAVVSVTQIHAGDTWNVIPGKVRIGGTVRCYDDDSQTGIETAMRNLTASVGSMFNIKTETFYERRYPATVNHAKETEIARMTAGLLVGDDKVNTSIRPAMGAEDFAFMLREKPGAFINLGNGPENGVYLHNSKYDFNDEALVYGASYWVQLVEAQLQA